MSTECDLLIANAHIVTMDDHQRQLPKGAVAVAGPRILAVGETDAISRNFTASRVIDAHGKVLLPGFINSHTHLFQGLLKGLGDGLDLLTWINKITGPAVLAMSYEDAYLGAMASCIENLLSGSTTVVEFMYGHTDHGIYEPIAQAMLDSGVRGVLGRGLSDTGVELGIRPELLEPAEAGLTNIAQLFDRYHGRDGRLYISVAVGVVWAMTLEGLLQVREFATEMGVRIQIHLNEYPVDDENCLLRFGKRTVPFLHDLKFLGPDVLAAHCVHISSEDVAMMSATGMAVSHNPVSNMYLGAGIMPLSEMVEADIPVGLATDGSASNNAQNMFETIKMAVLLQRLRHRATTVMDAYKGLWMATRGGARAIGMEDSLGSIEPGKLADLVLIDLDRPNTVAHHDPVTSIVYSGTPLNVDTVFVGGRVVVEEGRFVLGDQQDIYHRTQKAAERLRASILGFGEK